MRTTQAKFEHKSSHILVFMFLNLIFLSIDAKACHQCYYRDYYYCAKRVHVPVASCRAGDTYIPLPRFVCCQLLDRRGAKIWGNTWVAGTCTKAHPYAVYDWGCNKNSPVFGIGKPIVGHCHFYPISGYCW